MIVLSEHLLVTLLFVNQFVEEQNHFVDQRGDRVFVVADRGVVAVFYAHELVGNFWLLHANLWYSCCGKLVVLNDVIVSNHRVLFRFNHQDGQKNVLNVFFCQSLLLGPKHTDCWREMVLTFWIVLKVTPIFFVFRFQLLKLWGNLLLRAKKLIELE